MEKDKIKKEILECYEKQFAKIAYYYENGIMPEGMMSVGSLVGLISNLTGYSEDIVKDTIKDLKFKNDDERIIINQNRYEEIKDEIEKIPSIDLSNPEILDSIEQTKKALDNLVKKGEINLSADLDGNIDFEEFGKKMQEELDNIMQDSDQTIEVEFAGKNMDEENSGKGRVRVEQKQKVKNKRAIDEYGTNLTKQAAEGKVDKVVGREKEIERVIEILNRRSKNNPCLIGEPGVGKTAIAQGLALKIVSGEVPSKLLDKEIYLLDMGSLVAGTQFRGQFESRIKAIMNECKVAGNIIIVIDEVHTIVGTGDAENSTNAANILKPALSRGELQIIGTTTLNEYRKHIEKDSALERRFQPVMIEEPTIEEAIEIIEGIKGYFEEFHKVTISKEMIKKAVEMSEKYVHSRFLPDKAIDIIDEACSRINLTNKKLHELEMLTKELKKVQKQKEFAISSDSTEDYKKAAEIKQYECKIEDKIKEVKAEVKPIALTITDIAKVIEKWTKIPVSKITEKEIDKLINLEKNIHRRVIGQEEAVCAISKAIRRNRAGLQTTKRPPSFIFVGPTGVGKTELAKTVAYEMFGSEKSIIRVDMSEYMEKYSVSKIIGSAPGYVGYDEGGHLTEKVRRNPYSIILLDEIEKAHPDVFNILLQVLDDGRITDSQGRVINFENTVIIMTSNAGSNLNLNTIGFGDDKTKNTDKIDSALKETFRPEFLNRIDEIIVFNPLTDKELKQILNIFLANTQKALDNRNIKLEVKEDAQEYIISKGTNLKYGARPLRRAVQKEVEDRLTDLILANDLKDGQKVTVLVENNELKFVVE